MIWLASLTILLLSFSQHDVVEGRWSNSNSPWSNINQANSFMTCLVQNIASSPAFPLQEREDLESVVQTMLAAITSLVSSHRGNTATQIQAMNMAFASSMAEIIIAEDAGNSQLVAAKTEALEEELNICFKSVFGVVNRHFINEVQEMIRMFAEEAVSSDTYNEIDIGLDYGFGQSIGYGNAGTFSASGSGTAGSLSTATSTSTLTSTSTSTAAAAGSAAGAAGAAGAAFGAGFGGFAGAGSLVNSFASALAGSSVFQSIFGSGISTNLAASIAISAVQSSLSSVVSVSNSVSVGISNSLQSAIFNLGAGASASAYASAIASSVVSGLSSAGVLSSSSASSIVSSLVSVLLQNASAIASQYGISVSAAASAAASSATSASTTTSTSTSTGAAAGSAAGAAGAAGAAFGAGFGGFSGAGGFTNNLLPNLGGQNLGGISFPTDFTSLLSSPVGLYSQQSVSRIKGVISLLVQSFSANGISINAVGESIRRIFGETSASGLSASEAALEALLEVIVALLQILSSASVGNVSFSSIPNIARSLGQYAILG